MRALFSHSAGGVVLNSKGEVLVVRQRDGTWSLPKGRIQEGEDPRDTAVREIAEESGVTDLTFIKILKSYSRYRMAQNGQEDPNMFKRITMYLFTTVSDREPRPMDPRNPEAKWVKKEEVTSILTNPKDQDFFTAVLKEL